MDYLEFKRHIGKAGISTIREFAKITKANPTSITNFKNKGKVPKNMAIIATLMGLLGDKHIDFKQALSEIEVEAIPAKTKKT